MKNIFLGLTLLMSIQVYGQFNSKIGYSAWFHNMSEVDALFADFSNENEWLTKDLDGFSFTNSLEIGVKYRMNRLTFELGIISGQGESKAIGTNPSSQVNEEIRWKLSHFDYHVNVIQHFGGWGVGIGIANQRIKFREFNRISSEFMDVSSERNIAGRVFVQVEVPSNTVSFCLRPFYQFSLDDYDIRPLASTLGVSGANTQGQKVIGISLLFFNGPQS